MSYKPHHFACWFEIPVTGLEAAMGFYAAVFGMDLSITEAGPNPAVFFPVRDEMTGVSGHLYPGKPSENGPTIHLTVPDTLDAARVIAAGGLLDGPCIWVPAVRFCYARDLDGNSIGLFERAAA